MRNFIKYFIPLIFFTLLLGSCTDEDNPFSPSSTVDPKLVGEWYILNNISNNTPSPNISFSGIQITCDKKINSLGIETNTGEVAVSGSAGTLVTANNRIIIVKHFAYSDLYDDTIIYKIENED